MVGWLVSFMDGATVGDGDGRIVVDWLASFMDGATVGNGDGRIVGR